MMKLETEVDGWENEHKRLCSNISVWFSSMIGVGVSTAQGVHLAEFYTIA